MRRALKNLLYEKVEVSGKVEKLSKPLTRDIKVMLLTNVLINEELQVQHLWVQIDEFNNKLVNKRINFKGIVKPYIKNKIHHGRVQEIYDYCIEIVED